MLRHIYTLFIVLALFVGLTFAQEGTRDLSKTPSSFNNPGTVYGAEIDALSSLLESFEDAGFPPAGWVKQNPDGGTGWNRQTVGTTPIPGWNGGVITAPPGGGNAVAFCTWNTGGATSNDQWIITPQITNVQDGDSLIFWLLVPGYTNAYAENVDIKISTTGTNVGDFTTTVDLLTFAASHTDTLWTRYAYKLTDFVSAGANIYIGFREHVADNFNDGAAVLLDLVEVREAGGGSTILFTENFDSYTAGQQVACQNPAFWTTWSNAPCNVTEDPLVSNAFSHSSPNSAVVVFNNDLVKDFGTALTTGKYKISFYVYIPTGKAGYFNTLATFAGGSSDWGLEVYFDVGGGGRINAGGNNTATFAWNVAAWNYIEHVVDLDLDNSQFSVNGNQIYSWQWTLGASGTGVPLTLDANDFFGATANDEMYFDDYMLEDLTIIPVELSSFAATVTGTGDVVLNWTTETEVNNQGFQIERKAENGEYISIGYVQGRGTTTEQQTYSFTDGNVEAGTYFYRLKQLDFQGTFEYSQEIFVDVHPPLAFGLDQNYPNPFNPSTKIKFSLAEQSQVKLSIYNTLGELVQVLKNEQMSAGFYEVEFNAASLPSGVYIYKIETPNFSEARKMMLMK